MAEFDVRVDVSGIPYGLLDEASIGAMKVRLNLAVSKAFIPPHKPNVNVRLTTVSSKIGKDEIVEKSTVGSEASAEERAAAYIASAPVWTLDKLVISTNIKSDIMFSIYLMAIEHKMFEEWGLYEIERSPRTVLNFHGPTGTGKTMAAHAVANELGRKILSVSSANLVSMYQGETARNIEAVFLAAEKAEALLFLDEADSLLSKRIGAASNGSEQEINAARSQLLICLERFRGAAVFATNRPEVYDKAFMSRMRNVPFPMPDESARRKIWDIHLVSKIARTDDIDTSALAATFNTFSGRHIKNSVIDACVMAYRDGRHLSQSDLVAAAKRINESEKAIGSLQEGLDGRTGNKYVETLFAVQNCTTH